MTWTLKRKLKIVRRRSNGFSPKKNTPVPNLPMRRRIRRKASVIPCKCLGSVKLIYLECLYRWLEERKLERKGENSGCEICEYPFIVQTKEELVSLLLDMIESPYVIPEDLRKWGIHVISPTNKCSSSLDRGHDRDEG